MSQCPVCHKEVPDDFGLIECTGCKTPLIVQMDGTVQMAEGPAYKDHDTSFSEMLVDEAQEESHGAAESMQFAETVHDAPMVAFDSETSVPPPLPEAVMGSAALEPEQSVDAFFDDPAPAPLVAPPPISDMSQLANVTDTDAQAGSIRYNISVAGIDTAEIRKEFRELISDRRFLWDVDGILKSIRSGRVKMQNVTAVKAILLIHRLRALPVNVQWEQHVVHQD